MTSFLPELPEGINLESVQASAYGKASFNRRFFVDSLDVAFNPQENLLYNLEKLRGHCPFCGASLWSRDALGTLGLWAVNTKHEQTGVRWDHFQPASHWGLRTLGNFVAACYECNSEKSDSKPLAYYQSRVAQKRPLLFPSEAEFIAFFEDYSRPYREKFPRHYELTLNYDPKQVTEAQERATFFELFLEWEEAGEAALKFKPTLRTTLSSSSPSAEYFLELKESILTDPFSTERSIKGYASVLGTAQKNFDRIVLEKKLSCSSPAELTPRLFQSYCYSTLRFSYQESSASSFGNAKYVLKRMAEDSLRGELLDVVHKLPGKAVFRKLFKTADPNLKLEGYVAQKAASLKTALAKREAAVEDVQEELEGTQAARTLFDLIPRASGEVSGSLFDLAPRE